MRKTSKWWEIFEGTSRGGKFEWRELREIGKTVNTYKYCLQYLYTISTVSLFVLLNGDS